MSTTRVTPFSETRPRIPFEKFRELVEQYGLPETQPDPQHTGNHCQRCEWDMAVYGEALWDASTKRHASVPNLVRRRPV